MLRGDNGSGMGWILATEEEDTYHINASYFSGLIWQLNQFILTNIRNKHSLEFIRDNRILDKILEQYMDMKNDPQVGELLTFYIEYSKQFIDYVLQNTNTDLFTNNLLEEMRKEFFDVWKEKHAEERLDSSKKVV